MDHSATIAKTAKGADEIKSRAHGLPQKLRTLLILADGTVTVSALMAKFGSEVEASLQTLLDQGFVKLSGAAKPMASASGPTTVPSTPAPAETQAQARANLLRLLRDALGPDADLVTGALERAATRADFTAAAERCATMLAGLAGHAQAEQFRARASRYVERFFSEA